MSALFGIQFVTYLYKGVFVYHGCILIVDLLDISAPLASLGCLLATEFDPRSYFESIEMPWSIVWLHGVHEGGVLTQYQFTSLCQERL